MYLVPRIDPLTGAKVGDAKDILQNWYRQNNKIEQRVNELSYSNFNVTDAPQGLPRFKQQGFPNYTTLQRFPPTTLQRDQRRENMKRKTRSDWDLSGRTQDTPVSINLSTEPHTLETHYAESDVPKNNGNFFGSLRHHSHYFSNLDLFRPNGYNYLKYAKAEELGDGSTTSKPHLSVRRLSFSHDLRSGMERMMLRASRHLHTLHDVSFDLCGGETMALMYTTELEMRTLLRVLSGENVPPGRLSVDFSINGRSLRPKQLAARVAFVSHENPPDCLTVVQYLRISSSLEQSATNAFKVENMIDQLIQTLALAPFRNQMIGEIGDTEKQRLKIAAQVLKDTDILVCDNISRDMDIYDVAFVVDYLRDWAMKLKRMVIMAIAPNTLEILTMFHKAAILASGRFVYVGESDRMTTYFERQNFPCPMFKNPCDYYVDLVTHDHLTAEASQESLERIKQLADAWKRNKPTPREAVIDTVSPRVNPAGFFLTILTLYKRFWYVFYNKPLLYMKEPIFAAIISLFIGLVFFDLPVDKRSGANDRLGVISATLTYLTAAVSFVNIGIVCTERSFVHRDLSRNLYGAASYLLAKMVFDFPFAILTSSSLLIPMFFLSGLQKYNPSLWPSFFVCFFCTVLHLLLWRYVSWSTAYLCRARMAAATLFALLFSTAVLSSGIIINSNDQRGPIRLTRMTSPVYWHAKLMLETEFLGRSSLLQNLFTSSSRQTFNASELVFDCERRNVLATKIKEIPIYTVSQCSKIRGRQILALAGFDSLSQRPTYSSQWSDSSTGLLILLGWFIVIIVIMNMAVKCNHKPSFRTKRRQ